MKFRKSRLIDSLDIDNSLLEALSAMREGLNLMAFVSKDRTRLFGCLQMSDLLTHITTHWGARDTNCFKIQLQNFEMLFQQTLVRCKETDTLLQVMRKMTELRVSVVVIENATGEYSVGLCFLNDLLYLL